MDEFYFAQTKKSGEFARVKTARMPIRRRKRPLAPGEWGMVLADGAPIRRKARRAYEKALRDLDTAKAEAERFETEDKPKFDKWLSANFGALLTEIRELQEKLFHAQNLVNEVQQEFYYGNYRSIANAYKKVKRRRAHPEEQEEEARQFADEEAEFAREFEEAFQKQAEEFWSKLGMDPEELRRADAAMRPPETSGRLKDMYRKLARRLHPDKCGKRSRREIEWWHQTQDAYENGNIEQLELILTLVEMEDRGSEEATVSVLTQLTGEFKKSLRALKKKISAFRQDMAWNFSRLTDFSSLLEKTRRQLKADREQIVWLIEKYERQIQSWELAAASSASKRGRARRGTMREEEWF